MKEERGRVDSEERAEVGWKIKNRGRGRGMGKRREKGKGKLREKGAQRKMEGVRRVKADVHTEKGESAPEGIGENRYLRSDEGSP